MSINFVTAMAVKSFDVPDKKRCPDKAEFDLCTVNDYSVARLILGPGWRWSENTRPYERTDVCLHHHLGFCISGEMEVETAEGLRSTIHANDTYAIPPGHDEWVVGPKPFVAVEFLGAASFGRSGVRGEVLKRRVSASLCLRDQFADQLKEEWDAPGSETARTGK